ncbi:MAG: hypothetical protein ACUVTL_07495 [Thermoproteota archaeon]
MSFEFKRFGRTISIASSIEELYEKLEQLAKLDPGCVEYHLREGHISFWLESMGELDLAKALNHVKTSSEAASTVRKYLSEKRIKSLEQSGSDKTVCRNIHLVD